MQELQSYRVQFGGSHIDCRDNFEEVRKYWPILKEILDIADYCRIEHIWWFFEPYVEITWLANNNLLFNKVKMLLEAKNIKDVEAWGPARENGRFHDWYCKTEEEKDVGAKMYGASAKLARLFYENEQTLKRGKGWDNQYVRRCHTLANQLGFNYKQEGSMLFWRGILCWLFYYLGHKKAVWVYTKILRRKY